jgi:hypothetical protein
VEHVDSASHDERVEILGPLDGFRIYHLYRCSLLPEFLADELGDSLGRT